MWRNERRLPFLGACTRGKPKSGVELLSVGVVEAGHPLDAAALLLGSDLEEALHQEAAAPCNADTIAPTGQARGDHAMTSDDHLNAAGEQTQDRLLIRQMLRMTPTQRLEAVVAYWPFVQAGLKRRSARTTARS
jgi:hypothetical protein